MKTHLLKMNPCPLCRHTLEAATAIDDHTDPPRPGDFTICIECKFVLRYRLIEGALCLALVSDQVDQDEAIATFREIAPRARLVPALAVKLQDETAPALKGLLLMPVR